MKESDFINELIIMTPKKLQGFFSLYTKSIFDLQESENSHYTFLDNDKKVTIKCSRTIVKTESTSYFDKIFNSRLLADSLSDGDKFWCNFQQIKLSHLDYLLCYLMFSDRVYLLKIDTNQLQDEDLKFVCFQHFGSSDEGQFHITNINKKFFISQYAIKKIEYKDLFDFVKSV